MVERIGSREARQQFADLLGRVRYGGEVIIVERAGTPMAALVPVEMAEQMVAEQERRIGLRAVIDRIQAKLPDVPYAEIERDVADAVAQAREAAVEPYGPPTTEQPIAEYRDAESGS